MSTFRKLLVLLIVFSLLLSTFGVPVIYAQPQDNEQQKEEETAEELPFEVQAKSALLMEPNTGQILYAKNMDEAYPPASITKIMTLLLSLEAIEEGKINWEDTVVIGESAWRMQGSQMYLEIGQEVSVENLLKGISIVSANDACVAIAEHLYGSEALFVQKMNEKAAEIGLTNTHFENSSGWPDPNHYMSARDIAKLSAYAVKTQPKILELESQKEFTFNIESPQYNRNPLLRHYPGADGLKTGWTREAGYCLAGTARQDNYRLISVVLNCPTERARLIDSETLLNYGFKKFTYVVAAEKNEIVGKTPVPDGKTKEVNLVAADTLGAVVNFENNDKLETEIIHDKVSAPIKKGEKLGEMITSIEGTTLSKIDLLAEEEVERAGFLSIALRSVGNLFRNITGKLISKIKQVFE